MYHQEMFCLHFVEINMNFFSLYFHSQPKKEIMIFFFSSSPIASRYLFHKQVFTFTSNAQSGETCRVKNSSAVINWVRGDVLLILCSINTVSKGASCGCLDNLAAAYLIKYQIFAFSSIHGENFSMCLLFVWTRVFFFSLALFLFQPIFISQTF